MIKIKNMVKTCEACPSQWEIKLEDGRMMYGRYRWGCLTLSISESETDDIYDAVSGEVILSEDIGETGYEGCLSTEEFLERINGVLNDEQ